MRNNVARFLGAAGFVLWIANAIWHCSSAPLGHDEARYAGDTRELLDGHGKRYLYVPVGMNAVAVPGVLAECDERGLRALSLVLGVLFLGGAWLFARRVTCSDTAGWVVGVLAGARPIVKFSSDLLSDLPSAACLLTALAVLIPEVQRPTGPSYRVLWVAPLFAVSFYIRYGSCLTIAIVGAGALIFGMRSIARRPMPIALAIALLAGLLVPHFVYSQVKTGSPFGIVVMSTEVARHARVGLANYVTRNPFMMYGHLVAPLMIVGLVSWPWDRVSFTLRIIAVAQIVALGLTTLAQPRYILLAVVLLVTVGADAMRRAIATLGRRTRAWLAAVCAISVMTLWALTLADSYSSRSARMAASAPTMLASRVIEHDANGLPCMVMGWQTMQLDWYSSCRSQLHVPLDAIAAGARVYAVRANTDPAYQAEFEQASVIRCLVFKVPGVVDVFRLEPLGTQCVE